MNIIYLCHNLPKYCDDELVLKSATVSGVPEPDFNTFNTYSADRKTDAGKAIQSIIGTTQERTIYFSKTRRLEGSFYNYNYGVYAEIGVNGHTDKKNWIGWSKTESDELRVGWRGVVLKTSLPDYYSETMNDLNSTLIIPPQYMYVNGRHVNVVTLMMPDFKPELHDKILAKGAPALFDWLGGMYGQKDSPQQKAEAAIIATRTDLYFYAQPGDVKKFKTKSYTHVFGSDWMDFEVGYNSQTGFFVNGINQNNFNKIPSYLNVISRALNEKKPKLEEGEVYVCARFGHDWRGMKIKKNKK